MLFTNVNISFFNLCFDPFSIISKKFRNNVVYVVACLVFVFCCAVTTGGCNVFHHIFVNQKKSEFYSPYFFVTMLATTCWQDGEWEEGDSGECLYCTGEIQYNSCFITVLKWWISKNLKIENQNYKIQLGIKPFKQFTNSMGQLL